MAENIPPEILEDLQWFLDLNYVPADVMEEATYELSESDFVCGDAMRPGSAGPFNAAPKADESASESVKIESAGRLFNAGRAERSFKSSPVNILPEEPTPDFTEQNQMYMSGSPVINQEINLDIKESIDEVISGLGKTFQEQLLSLIDAKGYEDPQVYRKANLDRKHFSKIRCNKDYKPSKLTALALSVALELNLDETVDLLGRAGLALSPSSLTDMIIKYCITHQIYDIYDVNALLYKYDQQLLGS